MSARFIAILSPEIGAVTRMVEGTSWSDLGMTAIIERPGVAIFGEVAASPLRLGTTGVVFGALFPRCDTPKSVESLADDVIEALVASDGQALLKDYWGGYVAFLAPPDRDVVVVRDPSGAAPCYRLRVGRVEIFASDVADLVKVGLLQPQVDLDYVAHFLAYPFLRGRRTGLKGLSEVLAGAIVTFRFHKASLETVGWSPWTFAGAATDRRVDIPALRAEARRCVSAWAGRHRHILLELSGGLDSSIVAACLRGTSARVTCVNMVSPAPDGDERDHARAVATHLGFHLEEIPLREEALRLTATPRLKLAKPGAHALLGAWDETLGRYAQDHGVDAFMSGGGGDNVFFNTDMAGPAADALRTAGPTLRWLRAVRDLSDLHGCGALLAAKFSIRKAARALPSQSWRSDFRFLAPALHATAAQVHPWLDIPPGALPGRVDHIRSLMAVQNYLDGFARGQQAPIVLPLLSQPLVERCLAIPSWAWIEGGRDRAAARQAFRDDLPRSILNRRTKGNLAGFAGPAFERQRLALARHLLGGRLDQAGLLDHAALKTFLALAGPPRGSDFFRVLQIADVESWIRSWD